MEKSFNVGLIALGKLAAETAMKSAVSYIQKNNLRVDTQKLIESLRKHCKARLGEALDDSREAFEAGMKDIANQTFLLSMCQAGIDAAKEVGVPITEDEKEKKV